MLHKALRQLPYLVHTNRELGLMLKGVKPLTYFMEGVGDEPEVCIRYWRMFDTHVARGHLTKRESFGAWPDQPQFKYRRLFYTLPGQEWRVDAMLALLNEPGPWSDSHERRFGELLGYQDWQMDYWLAHRPSLRSNVSVHQDSDGRINHRFDHVDIDRIQ